VTHSSRREFSSTNNLRENCFPGCHSEVRGPHNELLKEKIDKMSTERAAESKTERSQRQLFQEYSEAFVVALIAATLIRAFSFQAFEIPSGSMEPTLLIGDHILVNKFIYGIRIPFTGKRWPEFREPSRGDVIVFVYPVDPSKDFIKRVIAVGGDTVEIRDKKVFVNGKETENPHARFFSDVIYPGNVVPRDNMEPAKVPEGALFVMGDNRDNSYDSRFWGFVPLRNVVGEAFIIYYSGRNITDLRWDRFFGIIR
jgi:signal peptidase I